MSGASVLMAFRGGVMKVVANRRYIWLAYGWNLALAVCLGALVHDAIRTSLGSSLAGDRMLAGWDSLWYYSFSAQASGVAATFKPSVSGKGAVLDALDAFLDGPAGLLRAGASVLPVAVLYLVSWTFLGGGFLATFAAKEPADGFLQRAARVFPRLLVVTLLGLLGYWVVLGPLRSRLDDAVAAALHDTIDERVRFAWTFAEHAALWMLAFGINLALDYTRVFVVRRDDVGLLLAPAKALVSAARLVLTQSWKTGALYIGTGLVWIALLLLYAAVAPGAGQSSAAAILGAFLIGQAYVLGRILVRCLFYASETVLCSALDVRP